MTESKLRHLTSDEIRCFRAFADFNLSLEQMQSCLGDLIAFDFAAKQGKRWLENRFVAPEPGVLITKRHIEHALDLRRKGKINERQLVEWATILLLAQAYDYDAQDEDFIAQWLNDISFELSPMD